MAQFRASIAPGVSLRKDNLSGTARKPSYEGIVEGNTSGLQAKKDGGTTTVPSSTITHERKGDE